MNPAELAHRFQYHPPRDERTKELHQTARENCFSLAVALDALLPEGREKALAMTNLEQVMLWSNAAIARAGEVAQ